MPASSKYWCFTINNPDDTLVEDDPNNWDGYTYVTWQKEDAGTPHYQGYVEYAKPKRLSAMKKISNRAHWEPRFGTQQEAITYCTKEETRVDGPWELGTKSIPSQGKRNDLEAACETAQKEGIAAVRTQHPVQFAKYNKGLEKLAAAAKVERASLKRKQQFESVVLRDWQAALLAKLDQPPDDRKILWYWENKGNVGKTWMAKYLAATKMATVLDCSKAADLKYLLRPHDGECVIFNLARSVDAEFRGHVYTLAEQIKDDLVINTKYESCAIPLGPQHVVVFANEPPDMTKWSEDRYDIHEIDTRTPFNYNEGAQLTRQNAMPPNPPKRAKKAPSPACANGCWENDEPCFCAQNGYAVKTNKQIAKMISKRDGAL